MEVKYDIPFEVSREQYKVFMTQLAGIVAGREQNGKYYIKVWMPKLFNQIINQ